MAAPPQITALPVATWGEMCAENPSDLKHYAGLALADGSAWRISARGKRASVVVGHLIRAMQLRPHDQSVTTLLLLAECSEDCRSDDGIAYVKNAWEPGNVRDESSQTPARRLYRDPCVEKRNTITYVMNLDGQTDMLALEFIMASLIIARGSERRGGLLLHGALAEREGAGVILAGPGGAGKTTASERLQLPWRSLCDDTVLVVRDPEGLYWAHPWPTWSNFMFGGPGGSWDVQHAVPLKGIFLLDQANEDQTQLVGPAHAACLLVEVAEQAWCGRRDHRRQDELEAERLQRFDNISRLVRAVPCYVLRFSLTGPFWQEIERALGGGVATSGELCISSFHLCV